ncbi:glycerol-3-phosphate dehydrogenase/oxidase [Pontibacter sp. G13]|uniref:glycerol-3-phosphate dehydrogenase/oxidase n=1 Tax=Pontibacter sp. G13 TaxID=3074898 RepID=UPI00288C1264|nr:glycerol-3-phosphate dehydrogenase/oxidase [Pontibacter sp. G13]WNJ20981.1 glycerol-3-phosphate dehydrogenase/oxidase [Pontibacter sp. G13]
MNRDQMIRRLQQRGSNPWDVIVIGGGATGLGIAVDAASRGYETLLLEKTDFAKGTSSRSTKLVHGGVRYLAQGDVSLVLEALHERGLLRQNAPHLVKDQEFVIPNYEWWSGPFYTVGMKVYDMMAGKLGLGPSISISRERTLKSIPNLKQDGLRGGVIYHDGQFDDARLAINLAQTAVDNQAVVINHMEVTGLTKDESEMVNGCMALDLEAGESYTIYGKVVINATGVFADEIMQLDNAAQPRMIRPSQGVHVVLNKEFLQGDSAIMIPKTSDGRVLFAVPWHDKVIVGTTDTPLEDHSSEPRALEEEIEFILTTASQYLAKAPQKSDVLSIFAGLRPLAAPQGNDQSTKEISRSHKLIISPSGLVTMTGGKWTTYRKMAQDAVDKAAMVGGLEERPCVTQSMPIHGYAKHIDPTDHRYIYGSDLTEIEELVFQNPKLGEAMHERLPFTRAEVLWAVREEMARTIEDVLARRVRALFLDARASIDMAPEVADIMAKELGKDDDWKTSQIDRYRELAQGYILEDEPSGANPRPSTA